MTTVQASFPDCSGLLKTPYVVAGCCFPFFHGPITPYVQVNDTHLHGHFERFMNMQGPTRSRKKHRRSKAKAPKEPKAKAPKVNNITGTDEEPKAKAPKVNHDKSSLSLRTQVRAKDPPIHEVSRESQQTNSDVDKFVFTLSMSCEEVD